MSNIANNHCEPNGIQVRLRSITYAAKDTQLYEFVQTDANTFPPVDPGAHVDLHLPNGLVRPYSLVHSGKELKSYVVGVKLDQKGRGGSRFIHNELRVGTLMSLSQPRNNFPLFANASHSVLIAGGIGITPIWCMAQQLESIGASWELWYSCRSRADMAFHSEMSKYEKKVHFHVDDEAQCLLDLSAVVSSARSGSHMYCCGPAPMLAAYETAASKLDPQNVHLEHFGAIQAASVAGGFTIQLAKSGKELSIPPGNSILDVLKTNGVNVNSSCLQGVCGYCEVKVLEGEVDHRDSILTPRERAANDTMMVCCSGAKSARLVLDL